MIYTSTSTSWLSNEENLQVKTINHARDGIQIIKGSSSRRETIQFMLEWLRTGMVAHKASGAANASGSTDSDGMVAHQNGCSQE
jgi:hypothetical protein